MKNLQQLKDIPILEIADKLNINVDRNNKAICFKGHDNKTPSLSFNTKDNYFKCFGCNIKGTIIDLVKEHNKSTVKDAIQWIKQKYGTTGAYNKPVFKQSNKRYPNTTYTDKTQYRANTSVLKGLKQHITQDSRKMSDYVGKKDGKQYSDIYKYFINLLDQTEAIDYLQSRGINKDITFNNDIKTIPVKNRKIQDKLKKKYDINLLIDAGLYAISKNNNPYFIFFNHRLIIPYYDTDGETILSLQGRNIDNDEHPKYKLLNGIKTVIYNLKALQDADRNGKTLYICEGITDALSCYQLKLWFPIAIAGVNNFNDDYFNLLKDYKLIIASDTDNAGQTFYRYLKKEYMQRHYKEIFTLSYNKLKQDFKINDNIKDLNELLQKAVL